MQGRRRRVPDEKGSGSATRDGTRPAHSRIEILTA